MSEAIPSGERFPHLEAILRDWTEILVRMKRKTDKFAFVNYLITLAYGAASFPPTNRELLEVAEDSGLRIDALTERLRTILDQDAHLRACCVDRLTLLYYLDRYFINDMASLQASGGPAPFAERYDGFVELTYNSGRFDRACFLHPFNFATTLPSLQFDEIVILKLDFANINKLLGQRPLTNFYQRPELGECFIVVRGHDGYGDSADPAGWAHECLKGISPFVQFLQYFKDGLTYVDYYVPHYTPEWVNVIRKGEGVFYLGNPRRTAYEGGAKNYTLEAQELDRATTLWKKHRRVVMPALAERTRFRETIWRAGDFFEGSFTKETAYERLLALAIALEALFSPGDNRELTFRLCQGASQLVGRSKEHRIYIYAELTRLYRLRSKLVHASYSIEDFINGRFVSHVEIDRWSGIVREAILRFIVLLQRGYNAKDGKDRLHRDLLDSALDQQKGDELREKSDYEQFFNSIVDS